ncbi:MAG: transcriptional regulator [Deltaproteobacteria bacterium]|nr:transcriptional regulator [Deltaproteobacteria bacterium]
MAVRKRGTRAPARNHQLVRILGVLRDVDRLGGTDLYELAAKWGAATRTIRRDLAALQEAGVPIIAEKGDRRVRWRTAYRDRMASGLTGLVDASHYLALRLAMQQAGPARRTSTIFAYLEDLSDRIEKALGPGDRERLAAIERCFLQHDRAVWDSAPPDVFWPLVDAISTSHLCQFTYKALGAKEPRDFTALPLRLFIHHGTGYVLAWIPKHDRILTLNLQRLRGLRSLRATATPPGGIDADGWVESAFGVWAGGPTTTYRLRFTAGAAAYVKERTWHPKQVLHDLADGGVELELTCGASPEITAWVASFRDSVEIVAPRSLRRDFADLGRWLASTYATGPRVLRPAPRAGTARAARRAS